ncbi:hypothetical protein JQ609_20010 [Bradyrhizobium sp. AUGA SZCCT0169]|uniref:hypothetical protein n=1 Tax=Bradyrhizobium sp. AUGA SZCCT0169 TaxID=2807663 RepID=UPI001BA8FFC4|nr:hypothetical protein [Bradyrhizobium sp. AUGA SZCCT0169]MBR1249200.1 hypothetical protein [Bradyrhizobium sp. AUGA SZCCT0169]
MAAKAMRANEEFFDLLAGDVFARLYTSFPEPIDIHSDAITYNDALGAQDGFDDEPERLKKLYRHAIQWLQAEGFVRFGSVVPGDEDDETFCDVVLTSKGLAALRKMPESLTGPGLTLGDKIEAAAKDIGSDAAKTSLKQLVPYALGLIKTLF